MASSSSRIMELASIIFKNTVLIDQFLISHDMPFPSFDVDAPEKLSLPKELEAIRAIVLNASTEIHELLLSPKELLISNTPNNLVSLHAIYHYKLASLVPVGGEATFAQIAEGCDLNVLDVRRILRHAMSNHIFKEPRKGVVAHTAVSKILAQDPQMQAWTGVCVEDMWPSAAQTVPAMIKWPNSQEPNHAGFSLANNTEESIYVEMGKDPGRAERFGAAMSGLITSEGYELHHVVDNIPWASIGTGTVVDMGGSHGDVMIAVAQNFPSLHCIVQDLPSTIESSPQPPANLKNRVSFMVHDFFTTQPIKGAAVYYFRWIFHNWSDAYCLKILRNLIPALQQGALIVVNDACLPEPNTLPGMMEKHIRTFDLAMLQLQNSRERGNEDWTELFSRADGRFRFLGVKQPRGSRLAFITAVWNDENAE